MKTSNNSVTEDTRIKKYRESPEVIRNLYASDDISNFIGNTFKKYTIDTSKKNVVDAIGDVILGFYKVADLLRLLQNEAGLDQTTASQIVDGLQEYLAPVIEHELAEANAKKAELGSLADRIAAIRPSEVTPEDLNFLSEEIPQVEEPSAEEHPIVKPIRTMETDAHRVHGYGALPQYHDDDEVVIKSTPQDEIRPTV